MTTGDDDIPRPGAGPHPLPWPVDARLDPALLRDGDRRNVTEDFRYWSVDAIRAELDTRRHEVELALENWFHDPNIGAAVRNANAFNVAAVHVVGKRRWNRRGAMMTEAYLHLRHHDSAAGLLEHARSHGLVLIGVDNIPGAVDIRTADIPRRCLLVLGQESTGLSAEVIAACQRVVAIPQYGSTRSINAGAASGIALYEWVRRHAAPP